MRRGKNFTAGLIGLALVLIAWAPAIAADPAVGGARISALEGEVWVQPGEGEDWRAAPINMPVLPGDRLQTGAGGRLEVFTSNGAAFRLGPESSARVLAVPPPEGTGQTTPAEVDLQAGRAIVETGGGDPSQPTMILDSAGARVYVYPGSRVRAEALGQDTTQVMLHAGQAWVDSAGNNIPLRPGETLQVGPSGTLRVANLPPDTFDRWSGARHRRPAAVPTTSPYVPAPLAPYTDELNAYGEWMTVPEYGYVWRPTTVVAGWSPFSSGQWLWRAGTWVWVPYEPWGYAVFHYGRWRWGGPLGWYWVPPQPRLVVWDPAPVAWVVTPSYVTWIPLAPGEVFASPWPSRIWRGAPSTTIINNVTNITVIQKTFINASAPVQVVAVPTTHFRNTTVVHTTVVNKAIVNNRVVNNPAVASSAPGVKRVSLANLVASQPARVVTPGALAPAVPEKRASAPPSARTTPVPGGPNARPQGRAPVPGAAAAPQREPERPTNALTAPPAPSRNSGRPGAWGREAGRPAETAPAAPQREPERPRTERPTNALTAPPAVAPRALPEPVRPAPPPPSERAQPREQAVRPEQRIQREQPRPGAWGREAGRPAEPAPAAPQREPERPRTERPTNALTAPPAVAPRALPEPPRPAPPPPSERAQPREQAVPREPRIEREQPRPPFRERELRPSPPPEPGRPAPSGERPYSRAETPRPQALMGRPQPPGARPEFRPAPTPHAVEPPRPLTPAPPAQAAFPPRPSPSPRQEAPPAAAPPQRQERGRHVAQTPPAPQPDRPSRPQPARPDQPAPPGLVR